MCNESLTPVWKVSGRCRCLDEQQEDYTLWSCKGVRTRISRTGPLLAGTECRPARCWRTRPPLPSISSPIPSDARAWDEGLWLGRWVTIWSSSLGMIYDLNEANLQWCSPQNPLPSRSGPKIFRALPAKKEIISPAHYSPNVPDMHDDWTRHQNLPCLEPLSESDHGLDVWRPMPWWTLRK